MATAVEAVPSVSRSAAQAAWYLPRDGSPAAAHRGPLAGLLELLGIDHAAALRTLAAGCAIRRLEAGTALFHQGARSHALYFVHSGTLKCVSMGVDGYEQVAAFATRGDVLGFDAIHCGIHPGAAVALDACTVFVVPRCMLDDLRHGIDGFDGALQRALSRQLMQAAENARLMSAVAAEVRLARFLLSWAARGTHDGEPRRRLVLPMSRREIASHLGVAHETVSRAFGLLAQWGLVHAENRLVEIVHPEGLQECASCTRGLAEEADFAHRGAARSNGLARRHRSPARQVRGVQATLAEAAH